MDLDYNDHTTSTLEPEKLQNLLDSQKPGKFHVITHNDEIKFNYGIFFRLRNIERSQRIYKYGCLPAYGLYATVTNATWLSVTLKANVSLEIRKRDDKEYQRSYDLGLITSKTDYSYWRSYSWPNFFGQTHNDNNLKLVAKALKRVEFKSN